MERLHYSRRLVRGAGVEEGTQRVSFLRRVTVLVAVATIGALGVITPAHAADDAGAGNSSSDVSAEAIGSSGEYVAITPTRILDTRSGAALNPGQTLSLGVTGVAGVPAGASGIAMNITVTQSWTSGFLTVYPGDVGLPLASNVNFDPGTTVPNLVIVGVPV